MRMILLLAAFLLIGGCGSVTKLNSWPFYTWDGSTHPTTKDLYLYRHSPGFAIGEASYTLEEYKLHREELLKTVPAGTELKISAIEVRRRMIGLQRFYVEVEVPFDGKLVHADISLYRRPCPIKLEWPCGGDTTAEPGCDATVVPDNE